MTDTSYDSYTNNPAKFVREILGNDIQFDVKGRQIAGNYPKQDAILQSVVKNKRTVVRAPNGTGKSIACAQLILWATSLFKDCTVITTAGSGRQVLSLWVEVNRMYSRCPIPLGGDILTTQIRFDKLKSRAYGFSTNKPEKFEGWHCVSPDHDVLTRRGWIPIAEVTTKDIVLSLDIKTGFADWFPVTAVQSYDAHGHMNEYSARGVSFCVTDGHRFPTKPNFNGDTWSLKPFSELGKRFIIRRVCNWNGTDIEVPECFRAAGFTKEQFVAFVGWWITEGNVGWTKRKKTGEKIYYSIEITQHKKEGRDKLRKILQNIRHRENDKAFFLCNRHIAFWLLNNCGHTCWQKRIPDLLMNATKPLLAILMEAILDGDGTRNKSNGSTLYTTSITLRDQVQELGIKLGLTGTCGVNNPKSNIGKTKRQCYTVSGPSKGTEHRVRMADVVRVPYEGKSTVSAPPTRHSLSEGTVEYAGREILNAYLSSSTKLKASSRTFLTPQNGY